MEEIASVGLDTAQSVFRAHGVDCDHDPIIRRQLKRRQVLVFCQATACPIGIEGCSASH